MCVNVIIFKKIMSFNDYQTISQLLTEYKIEYQQQDFVKESWTETSIVFDIDFEFHETCYNIDQSYIAALVQSNCCAKNLT